MTFKPVFEDFTRPIQILGPCSAETEKQVMETARQLAERDIKVDLFRAGMWKPRTRPNPIDGIGTEGLERLKKVRDEFGFKITTEVANNDHAFEAITAEVDVVRIGARRRVSPIAVKESAGGLRGTGMSGVVKNPINPDLSLWMGGIERLLNVGLSGVGAIHRGFSKFGDTVYRNKPEWQIPLALQREMPGIQIITDASHIAGNRENLYQVSQSALNLNFEGLMLETHCTPDDAWSDAA